MRGRRIGFVLICSAAIPLVIAATAWACGVLAFLKLDTSVARPGQLVTATGGNYGQVSSNSPVSIRLDSRRGPVLATATPDPGGKINTTFNVPATARTGWHVIMATQTTSSGTPKSGTPGRTTLRIQGAAKGSSGPVAAWGPSKPTGPGGSEASVGSAGTPAVLPTLLGILASLALLGTGLTLVRRGRARAADRPALGF